MVKAPLGNHRVITASYMPFWGRALDSMVGWGGWVTPLYTSYRKADTLLQSWLLPQFPKRS